MSNIEWTGRTWNPTSGCNKISQGCKHCYAEVMAKRLKAMGVPEYRDGFAPTEHPHRLAEPYGWNKPQTVFVCSMSDLFHESFSNKHIMDVFRVMNDCERHTFQVLTKRPERLRRMAEADLIRFSPNIWVGVSVEDQDNADVRIPHLLKVPARVRFLSCEPLLGALRLEEWLPRLHWVIVGGESGKGARPMHPDWARSLRDQCADHKVRFFFKQWGEYCPALDSHGQEFRTQFNCLGIGGSFHGDKIPKSKHRAHTFENGLVVARVGKKAAGRLLDGVLHDAMPLPY